MSKKKETLFIPYAKPEDNNMYIPEIISRKINGVEKDEIDIMEKVAFKEVQELMNGESQEIDYHGCDHFFLMDFVTPEMDYDFPLIANEFLQHEYKNLKKYNAGYYIDYYSDEVNPVQMMQNRILNMMYCAAKQDNAYVVNLFQTLYKVYHKKEYKQLKRFQSISAGEALALSGNNLDDLDSAMNMGALARILTMAKFYKIEIKKENIFLYRYMNRNWDDFQEWRDDAIEDCLTITPENYRKAAEEVEDLKASENKKNVRDQADQKAMEFVEAALRYMGYPFDYGYRLDERWKGTESELIRVSAILKEENPNKQYSLEEMRVYAVILMLIRGICNQMNEQDLYFDQMLGIDPDIEDDHIFKAEMLRNINTTEKKSILVKTLPAMSQKELFSESNNHISEIVELQNKLKHKERELKTVQARYAEVRDELNFLRIKNQEYEKEHDELIALRNHVYKFTEQIGENRGQTVDIQAMKTAIQNKTIIIVGGNENWVKKLRQEFPNWKYIKANASPTIASMPVMNAERVYFFTDTMGHSNYYKFMQVVRDHKVPFSYIHGVNIESNIRQIYEEMILVNNEKDR